MRPREPHIEEMRLGNGYPFVMAAYAACRATMRHAKTAKASKPRRREQCVEYVALNSAHISENELSSIIWPDGKTVVVGVVERRAVAL
jgi:hypothetical protein